MYIQDLAATDRLTNLLMDVFNLRFILNLYLTLYNTISRDMYSALRLGSYINSGDTKLDIQDIQYEATQIFNDFTTQTGICGLTADYQTMFDNTLVAIGTPLLPQHVKPFEQNTNNRRMATLLKKHLVSLKKRRIGA